MQWALLLIVRPAEEIEPPGTRFFCAWNQRAYGRLEGAKLIGNPYGTHRWFLSIVSAFGFGRGVRGPVEVDDGRACAVEGRDPAAVVAQKPEAVGVVHDAGSRGETSMQGQRLWQQQKSAWATSLSCQLSPLDQIPAMTVFPR